MEASSYASLSSSVRYLGASAFNLSMNPACSFSSSFCEGVVRVAIGTVSLNARLAHFKLLTPSKAWGPWKIRGPELLLGGPRLRYHTSSIAAPFGNAIIASI
jgi:hypothetical protein